MLSRVKEVINRYAESLMLLIIVGIFAVFMLMAASKLHQYEVTIDKQTAQIHELQDKIESQGKEIQGYQTELTDKNNQIQKLQNEIKTIRSTVGEPIIQHVSRGGLVRRAKMKVTAYSLAVKDCGKSPGSPEYGITASGNHVKEWYTVAMGRGIPMGTKIYIPYFKDYPNGGVFYKEDTGKSDVVTDGVVDVYMADTKKSDRFGAKYLDVYILR